MLPTAPIAVKENAIIGAGESILPRVAPACANLIYGEGDALSPVGRRVLDVVGDRGRNLGMVGIAPSEFVAAGRRRSVGRSGRAVSRHLRKAGLRRNHPPSASFAL